MSKIVEVAAAVMLRETQGQTEFLLACRPEGKVYAGYWEFPGGKVESGESVRAALVRELQEEMGITVTDASPWLHKQFEYPHATVHLNFWRVTAWTGEIGITAPLEHSAVSWVPVRDALMAERHLSPILPANGPILKGLALPRQMLITHAVGNGVSAELQRLDDWVSAQTAVPAIVQIRDRELPASERAEFARAVVARCHAAGLPVVLNCADAAEFALANSLGVDGVHLTSGLFASLCAASAARPDFEWVGASCHAEAEIRLAGEMGLDYAVLGPVLPTQTHPGAVTLGWDGFQRTISDNRLPVFALGGLQAEHQAQAVQLGAQGIAQLRGW